MKMNARMLGFPEGTHKAQIFNTVTGSAGDNLVEFCESMNDEQLNHLTSDQVYNHLESIYKIDLRHAIKNFHEMKQAYRESITQWGQRLNKKVLALKRINEHAVTEESIIVKFITGLQNREIQRNLLLQDPTTRSEAFRSAQRLESILDTKPRQPRLGNESKMQSHNDKGIQSFIPDHTCIRCGESHLVRDCRNPRESLRCDFCGLSGHVEKVCLRKKRTIVKQEPRVNRIKKQMAINKSRYVLTNIFNAQNDHVAQKALLDSGSEINLIHRDIYLSLHSQAELNKYEENS